MGKTKFSVIVPAFNVAPYIEECIQSALHQTYQDFEVIVVDDCSTDGTSDIVRNFSDDRLRLTRNPANRGVSYTRNAGIDAAAGEYIVLLDSDDHIAANRLEVIARHLDSSPDMVLDDLMYFPDGGAATGDTAYSRRGLDGADLNTFGFAEFLQHDLGILQGTIKKAFLDEYHIRYEEGFDAGEDFAFYADIFLNGGTVTYIPDALYSYRQRDNSLIRAASERAYSSLVSTTQLVLDRYPQELANEPAARALLEGRRRHQTHVLNYYLMTTHIKRKNLLGAASLLAKDPSLGVALGKKGLDKLKSLVR